MKCAAMSTNCGVPNYPEACASNQQPSTGLCCEARGQRTGASETLEELLLRCGEAFRLVKADAHLWVAVKIAGVAIAIHSG